MRALTPWTGTGLRREMDRLFDRFFESPWTELPGIDAKDIAVSLEGDVLTIKGEKEQKKEEKDERQHRVERSWGAFMRSVRLPAPVDSGKVSAAFKDGVVTITLPKAPGAKGATIPVKAE